jgi:MFS family permease
MLFRFCLYGFLKNQRYFEPFLMLVFLERGLSFFVIGLLIACRDLTVNLLEIPSGAIADSFGRRRSMMISFVAYIVSFAILGASSLTGLIFIGMIFYGIGDTFRTGTHKAMIFEWLRLNDRSDQRTRIYGLTRSWSQIGSAVSGMIAAIMVLISGSFNYVFYFAIVPYALNLINFAGYPRELDGEHLKAQSVAELAKRMKASLHSAVSKPRLRKLIVESMGWEGFFAATKDYLQPVLQALAITGIAYWFGERVAGQGQGAPWLNETRQTALLIGPVFACLFLLSAGASRNSHRVVDRFGDESTASKWLWLGNLILFVTIGVSAWFEQMWILVAAFVGLYMLKNIWRPILISRFDNLAEPHEGATVLSIESQAQRMATLVMAPAIGWAIDSIKHNGWGGEFWPIGLAGGLIAIWMFVRTSFDRQPHTAPTTP